MALIALKPSQDLIDLVGSLGGSWHGRTAMCPCPAHADRTPSLSIRQGERGILVTCFAGCLREDVLRELRRVPVRQHYSYTDVPHSVRGNVTRLWDEAIPIAGTLAERYVESRFLLPLADDLRFHPRCPYRPRPWTTFHPALLVAVREGRTLVAIQRIFLDPATARYRMKLMLGRPARGAWQGGGQGGTVLALAEGFETAQAFTILKTLPCWASLGARRFDLVRLPDHISHLILAVDNDAEGYRAADRAETVYVRPDLHVERMPPPAGFKDWAKVLEARAADQALR
ncbi:DUF7146 domain-containing protein [Sphingobium xenophagum]|uniref:DUF7146 domain-containing protein n=1 Tax=Sphingobium xenophagum TaxID=121428 RepID=UPI001C0CAEC0|nr:toprim domain-containing protein [Sphingobium xenophagum]QWT16706.1 toprim domain-containing protein [Sphingobium xenophagum]